MMRGESPPCRTWAGKESGRGAPRCAAPHLVLEAVVQDEYLVVLPLPRGATAHSESGVPRRGQDGVGAPAFARRGLSGIVIWWGERDAAGARSRALDLFSEVGVVRGEGFSEEQKEGERTGRSAGVCGSPGGGWRTWR